jgi:hypothetical protein
MSSIARNKRRVPWLRMHTQAAPFNNISDDYLSVGCSFSLLGIFLCCLVFKVRFGTRRSDEEWTVPTKVSLVGRTRQVGTLTELQNVNGVMSREQRADVRRRDHNARDCFARAAA